MKLLHAIRQKMLLNYPLLWSTRAIPALAISLSVNILLFVIFYLSATPLGDIDGDDWIAFFALCSIVCCILYLVFLLRFNAFKLFGKLPWYSFVLQLLLYFMVFGSIVLYPFMPKLAIHLKVSKEFTQEDLDIAKDEANILINKLEYTQSTVPYREVLLEFVDSLSEKRNDYANNYRVVFSDELFDSTDYVYIEKLTDSTALARERVVLGCSYNYELNDSIYKSLPETHADSLKYQQRLSDIFARYIVGYNGNIYNHAVAHEYLYPNVKVRAAEPFYDQDKCDKYLMADLENGVGKISRKLIGAWEFDDLFRIWFYFSLYISLFVLIFRHMTVRTFLWTLLFGFLLFVFTAIMGASLNSDGKTMLLIILLYYAISLLFSIFIFTAKCRNVFFGIALNLSFFFLQLVPVFIVLLIKEYQSRYTHFDSEASQIQYYWPAWEALGLVLLILSALFFHSRLYHRWFSLPQK